MNNVDGNFIRQIKEVKREYAERGTFYLKIAGGILLAALCTAIWLIGVMAL